MSSIGRSGFPLRRQAREIIYNVAKYVKDMKQKYKLAYNVTASTSEATGVSEGVVKAIIKEGDRSMSTNGRLMFSTPKKRSAPRKKSVVVDEFVEGVVRREIHNCYTVKKVVPTIRTLNAALKASDTINCSDEYLRKLIRRLGFRWKKCQSRRKLLIEKPEIAAWRAKYLRQIRKYRSEKRNIVYLDETYLHASHTVHSCWQSQDEIGVTSAIGKGPRLIIAHAGGEAGFIDNALLIYKSQQQTGDYHNDMNSENFTKWLQTQVLPNLPPRSVIVMDNMSYHSVQSDKQPTSRTLLKDIKQWLIDHHIPFNNNMRKPELLMLAKRSHHEKVYVIDQLLREQEHEVLRLAPYHADLNPIELVWGDIKGAVARDTSNESLNRKRELCEELFKNYSVEKWRKCCNHVIKIEQSYWQADGLIDEVIDSIIMSGNDDSNSNSDTSELDSDTQVENSSAV